MSLYQNTIKSLCERILRILNLGPIPRDSRFSLRDIEYAVRDSMAIQILRSWSLARQSKEAIDISDQFVIPIVKQVSTENGECFVDLDFDWVLIPDGSGLQSVRPDRGTNNILDQSYNSLQAFIPIPSRFDDIYRNLPAGALEGQIGWKNRGKRIIFSKLLGQTIADLGITSVVIDAVTTSDFLSVDTPLSIPPDVSDAIVKEVSAFFTPLMKGQKDMLNDNSSNAKPLKS